MSATGVELILRRRWLYPSLAFKRADIWSVGMTEAKPKPISASVNFATAGAGGLLGWICVHPFNTLSIRMNLAGANPASTAPKTFLKFAQHAVKSDGVLGLYSGLGAGLLRQLFYATSRFGFFEVFRDELAKYRETDFVSRLLCGVTAGGTILLPPTRFSTRGEVLLGRISLRELPALPNAGSAKSSTFPRTFARKVY